MIHTLDLLFIENLKKDESEILLLSTGRFLKEEYKMHRSSNILSTYKAAINVDSLKQFPVTLPAKDPSLITLGVLNRTLSILKCVFSYFDIDKQMLLLLGTMKFNHRMCEREKKASRSILQIIEVISSSYFFFLSLPIER